MSAILLNRQNARHIGEVDIRLILQHIPQKIQINFLGFVVFSVLAENAVPFIDNHHKGPGRKTIHILHGPHQIFRIKIAEIRIFLHSQRTVRRIRPIICSMFPLWLRNSCIFRKIT